MRDLCYSSAYWLQYWDAGGQAASQARSQPHAPYDQQPEDILSPQLPWGPWGPTASCWDPTPITSGAISALGYPRPLGASLVAQTVRNSPAMWETWILSSLLGKYPGEGNGNPFQCFCLENSRDRGAWWATVHGVTKLDTTS